MTKQEIMEALEEELESRVDELRFIVTDNNGKMVARFLRRWQAEKFIEMDSKHAYHLIAE